MKELYSICRLDLTAIFDFVCFYKQLIFIFIDMYMAHSCTHYKYCSLAWCTLIDELQSSTHAKDAFWISVFLILKKTFSKNDNIVWLYVNQVWKKLISSLNNQATNPQKLKRNSVWILSKACGIYLDPLDVSFRLKHIISTCFAFPYLHTFAS